MSTLLRAQEYPPVEIYPPNLYGGENQNWSISQSKERYVYVANNKGLLEFNGAEWKLYPSPNETIIRSVSVLNDHIYTGCSNEFGYWQRNELGDLFYTSLSKKLNIEFLDDEDIWDIVDLDDFILFQSTKRIYIYNKLNNSHSIINSQTGVYKVFKVNSSIYFQKTKEGVFKIVNGKEKLVYKHKILKNNRIVNIYSYNGALLIETENTGFYILDNKELHKWNVPANRELSNLSVFRSTQLRDGSFMLGTRSNGILHLSSDGNINYRMNASNGLSSNTVHSIFEDADNNIWLALDNGINCINIKSPYSIYNDKEGKIGTVYASKVFDNYLYLGTNQGLFCKPVNSNKTFQFIKGTQGPVRCLVVYKGTLFCGHNSGTFVIKKNQADLIVDVQDTWNIMSLNNKENLLLQGNYDGLHVIERLNGKWQLKNKITGFNASSRYFELLNNNQIFVNHEYQGVFKITVDSAFTKVLEVVKDTSVVKGANSGLIKYQGEIYYASKNGVYKYEKTKDGFVRDSLLNNLYSKSDYLSGKLISDDKNNILFGISKKNLSYVSSGELAGKLKIKKLPYSDALPRGAPGYENISYLKNNTYIIGTSTGYIVADFDNIQDKPYQIAINAIRKYHKNGDQETVNQRTKGDFRNKNNNIEFTYSVAEFDTYLDTQYQYQLIGIYPEWSTWSTKSNALFDNLPYGNFTFNVRARIGNKLTNNIASYVFSIEKPWQFSNIMFVVYFVLFFLFLLVLLNSYKHYYRKLEADLVHKTEQELEIKELENQKQRMRFNNEKLRQDIESKNRELGISTMNLIKKNKILNTIKNELNRISDKDRELKSVIRIIDKDLNNTDDWNLFQEAFNNADRDFLKKVKQLHPSLTSNDLRLCAYLRLNLSSKEIAPLLNISPRSVEVKRYRLRKKMNLPHEANLTNYILEI